MTDKQTGGHTYGAADDNNRQPPGPEGFRGENAETDAKATHGVIGAGGQVVEVEETSGIAAAEAAGTTGLKRDADP
jgi:hypothetical protein